jgi:N-methylhydantoinase A
VVYQIDVRYHGQGFELPILTDLEQFARGGLAEIGAQFDDTHKRLFTFALDAEKEIVNLRTIVQGKPALVESSELPEGGADPTAARTGSNRIWVRKRETEAAIYDRSKLATGNQIPGPAIVTEMDSTTLILPDHVGTVHRSGNILIRPTAH